MPIMNLNPSEHVIALRIHSLIRKHGDGMSYVELATNLNQLSIEVDGITRATLWTGHSIRDYMSRLGWTMRLQVERSRNESATTGRSVKREGRRLWPDYEETARVRNKATVEDNALVGAGELKTTMAMTRLSDGGAESD